LGFVLFALGGIMMNIRLFVKGLCYLFFITGLVVLQLAGTATADNPGRYPLAATADAYVFEGTASTNHGDHQYLFVGEDLEFEYRKRAFLRFDHTPLPRDAVIGNARLRMYMHHFGGAGSVDLSIGTVSESWAEETVTWENQKNAEHVSTMTVTSETGLKSFNITDIVQRWVNRTLPNNGIMISVADESGAAADVGFYSSDAGRVGCRPHIEVTYTTREAPPEAPDTPLCGTRSDETPPVVNIIVSPDPAIGGRPVEVRAEVTDDRGVHRVQLYRGAELVANEESDSGSRALTATENTTLEPGIHRYSALAYDTEMNGVSASMLLQVYPGGAPPRIWIDHEPDSPNIGDPVTFTVRTEFENPVRQISIRLNGSAIDEDYTPPEENPTKTIISTDGAIGADISTARVIRYAASATDENGVMVSTGTKYTLFENTGPDADGDHLSDEIEEIMGLDPNSNDTDGDGLYDHWEVLGFQTEGEDGLVEIDLPGMGASPYQKDVFLEIDWLEDDDHSHALHPRAIQAVVNAYRDYAIRLHVDTGNLGGGNAIEHTDWYDGWFWEMREENYDFNRRGLFYYALACHINSNYKTLGNFIIRTYDPGSSGRLATPAGHAEHLMHELGHGMGLGHGGQTEGVKTRYFRGPDGDWIQDTVQGIYDTINYKPNYLSNMNYRYQWDFKMQTKDGDDVYIYSYYTGPDTELDENNLDESAGFVAPAELGAYVWRRESNNWELFHSRLQGTYYIKTHQSYESSDGDNNCSYNTASFLADGATWIDWNFSGGDTPDPGTISYDLNQSCHNRCAGQPDCTCDCSEYNNTQSMPARFEISRIQPQIYGTHLPRAAIDHADYYVGSPDPNEAPPLPTDGEYSDGIDNDFDGRIDEGFPDFDKDRISDPIDNCPFTHNPQQIDANRNNIGDACEKPSKMPVDLNGRVGDNGAVLNWTSDGSDTNIVGYNVYRKTSKDGTFKRLTTSYPTTLTTDYTDSSVINEEAVDDLYYSVTAVNFYMDESPFSKAVALKDSGAKKPPKVIFILLFILLLILIILFLLVSIWR
jgi:hypothetical protein